MPRPNKKVPLSSYAKSQLANHIFNIVRIHRRGPRVRNMEQFLQKAKDSVMAFLRDMSVRQEDAERIAHNLQGLFVNFRSGNIDYVEDIVNGVIDTEYDDSS